MIKAPATLAMLGGGQLGRFFVNTAHELGYKVLVLDPDPHSPAGLLADEHLIAPYDSDEALKYIADHCDAGTTEFENVPADSLSTLSQRIPVRPSSIVVAIAQDRIAEKYFLRDHDFATAPFISIESEADFHQATEEMFPAILKIARFGYDGKGQAHVNNVEEAKLAFQQLESDCVLEKKVSLDLELSVVMARNPNGECQAFTPAENQHSNGILDISIVPARVSEALLNQAETMANRLADKLDYVGILAVEFFVCNGELLINEVAPRPHNSGHYTIDGCITNQFEQQVRAMCDLPLGSPKLHSHSVMVNLLGDLWFADDVNKSQEPDWSILNSIPNLKLHLYGKESARVGRKMGHFTVIGDNADAVLKTALEARAAIGIKD